MKLDSKKYFYIMSALVFLLLCAIIAGTVVGNMLLKKQSEKLTALKVENKAIDMQQSALAQARRDIERYNELDSIAKSIVPQDKDQAKTIREIVKIAAENRIPIKSIEFDNSTLGDSAAAKAAAGAAAAPAAGGAKPAQAPASQLKAVEGIPGVYTLEIRVVSGGEVNYQNFLKFLEGLEKNRRTAHVTLISVIPNPADGSRLSSFRLTLNAYVKP
jgi:hypothetical protein